MAEKPPRSRAKKVVEDPPRDFIQNEADQAAGNAYLHEVENGTQKKMNESFLNLSPTPVESTPEEKEQMEQMLIDADPSAAHFDRLSKKHRILERHGRERQADELRASKAIEASVEGKAKYAEALEKQEKSTAEMRTEVARRLERRGEIAQEIKGKETEIAELREKLKDAHVRPGPVRTRIKDIEGEIEFLKEHSKNVLLRNGRKSREVAPTPSTTPPESVAVVPDVSNEQVKAGVFGTDPVREPETPKEIRTALEEAARIYQSGGDYMEQTAAAAQAEQALKAQKMAEEAARIYQTGEGYIDSNAPKAAVLEKQNIAAPAETTPDKPPRDPMGPNEDGKSIVMLNSVLTRQAMGAKSKNDPKLEPFKPFPAVPGSAAPAAVAAPVTTRESRLAKKEKDKKRGWLVAGGLGALAGAGLLAWLGLSGGKKEEVVKPEPKPRPAAAKSAAEAGVKTPAAGPVTSPETAPAQAVVKVPKAEAPAITSQTQTTTPMQSGANFSYSWENRFNKWEAKEQGRTAAQSSAEHIERMAREEGYSVQAPIVGNSNEHLTQSQKPAAAETAPAPTPKTEVAPAPTRLSSRVKSKETAPASSTRFEVIPSETHLYSIRDANEPGGEALVVYGGGNAANNEAYMTKLREFAKQHPGRTIYFDPGLPTIVNGQEVKWVASGVYQGGVFMPNMEPLPNLIGVELNPATFTKKVG